MKKLLLHSRLFLFFLLCSPLAAQNGEKPVPVDSPVYAWLNQLYASQERSIPSHVAPYTKAETLYYLSLIDASKMNAAEQRLAQAIKKELEEKPFYTEKTPTPDDGLAANILQQLNPELFLNLGNQGLPWNFNYYSRPPFYSVTLEGWALGHAYGAFDMELKKDPFVVIDQSQPVSNFPSGMDQIDFLWPYWAGLVLGGDHWDVRFFRSPMSWANGTYNLTLSADAGTMDQIMITSWWSGLKYTFLWVPMDDYKVDTSQSHYGYFNTDEDKVHNNPNILGTKSLIIHRLDFRFLEKWTIAMSEILIVSQLEPQYLNPFFPGHNWFLQSDANSDITFDFEGALLPGWTIFGQWYGDYIKTPFKDAVFSDATPASYGYLLGSRLTFTLGEANGTFEAVGVYTDPFFYLNNHVNMIHTARFDSTYNGTDGMGVRIIDRPFGFTPGPDTIFANLSMRVEVPRVWKAEVSTPFQAHGENSLRTIHPLNPLSSFYSDAPSVYNDLRTPTGTVELEQSLVLEGELGPDFLQWPWDSSIGLRFELLGVWNQNHVLSPPVFALQSVLTWKNTF